MLKRLLNVVAAATAVAAVPEAADPGPFGELLAPIDGDPPGAGIDLGYEDEYAAIQDQIAKRGDIDDDLIRGQAALLLRSRGKDLRAAVFLAYSTLRVEGLDSATQALSLLPALVGRFGANVHPRKPAARRAALEWLCSERFLDPLSLQARAASEAQLLALQAVMRQLMTAVSAWPEEARPQLAGIAQRIELWLDEKAQRELRLAVETETTPESPLAAPGKDVAAHNPKSALEAWALIRRASAVLRADPAWASGGQALLRAARFASVGEMPPHEGGVTRFAAPRREARAYVANLHDTAQWPALLDECTRLFNEGANHLWFDLLLWSDSAFRQLGGAHELMRAQLALDLRQLLARLPRLPELKFDDGLPFASPKARDWIRELLQPPTPPTASAPAAEPELQAVLDEANALARTQGLAAALALLQAQPSAGQQERFAVQRLMLILAREAGQPALALGLARELAAQVDEFSLARWAPALTFEVWADLHALLRSGGPAQQAEARALHGRLCGLDPVRALALPPASS